MGAYGSMKKKGGGDYMKWESPGDSITGVVVEKGVGTNPFDDDAEVPELRIESAVEGLKTITATQVVLHDLIIEKDDDFDEGDTITITFSGMAGQAKLFTLEVGGSATAASNGGTPPPLA